MIDLLSPTNSVVVTAHSQGAASGFVRLGGVWDCISGTRLLPTGLQGRAFEVRYKSSVMDTS